MNTATLQFIARFKDENPLKLALKSDKFPDVDMRFALRQIAGRQSIKEKLPTWYASEGILYPEHLPLEQCSSEATARYKAQLVQGNSL
ncbi:MAG: SAM-dependent methyltransferase, partial [Bacteroidota bacterium]|nr:SAM-dependent methyltransferase [Bacteroidota bacterium]